MIKLIPVSVRLQATRQSVYTCPPDCISATVVAGTATHIKESEQSAKINMVKGGTERWIVQNGKIPYIGSPWKVPVITLAPGQSLEVWADADGVLDLNLTIGEQR